MDEEQDSLQNKHEERGAVTAPLIHQPYESVVDLEIKDLLGFLHRHHANCPKLQMICPWFGIPLPSIEMELDSSLEWTAKLEFSIGLSDALMRYVRASRTAAAKVSH